MKAKLSLFVLIFVAVISLNAQIRVACVGNSITYGAGINGRDSLSYPAQLQKMLGSSYKVKNYGLSGRTLLKSGDRPYWKEPLFDSAKAFLPNIVIIKLGTNDSKPFNWDSSSTEYIPDYIEMIKLFQALPSNPIVILGIPAPVFGDAFNIRANVVHEQIVPMVTKLALDMQLKTIDFYTLLKDHPEMFPDKIHPDANGAKLMAEEVLRVLKSIQ